MSDSEKGGGVMKPNCESEAKEDLEFQPPVDPARGVGYYQLMATNLARVAVRTPTGWVITDAALADVDSDHRTRRFMREMVLP